MNKLFLPLAAALVLSLHLQAAPPKKLLLVTTTTGFRHSSIPTAQKILSQLAAESQSYTIDQIEQPANKPNPPKKPSPLKTDASDSEKAKFAAEQAAFEQQMLSYKPQEMAWLETLSAALQKLSPESLKNYDGVIFANTTGDLPIPDKRAFLDWLKSGKAFIGMHSASDTFHGWPEYIEMLGGEFAGHGAQACVECLVEQPNHPATNHLGAKWLIPQEEIYLFKNYEASRVDQLLALDKHPNTQAPGQFPVSWTRQYGEGRVFYTSLGHREDIWDADPALANRKNPVEVSKAYQAHILGGIQWALGLTQNKP